MFKVFEINVAAPLVPVVVSVIVSCFKFNAVCVAVLIGLLRSLVLLTFSKDNDVFNILGVVFLVSFALTSSIISKSAVGSTDVARTKPGID